MKHISIVFSYILIFTACTAQTTESIDDVNNINYKRISGDNTWGYIDNRGDTIIPLGKYNFLNPIDEEGMIFAQLKDKYGYIDIFQNTIIPFEYDDLSVFSEGLAPARKNDKYGYINRRGEVIIPFQFDKERHFYKSGLSEASIVGKWGFINTKGEQVVPIKYSQEEKWIAFFKTAEVVNN